jgi:hypothetical protein
MAGESAREVARRAREKADRLNRRAELFERGADGEAATAEVLAALPPDWVALHDVRWPGRRLANVDHVVIGPGGVLVIDSKNWTGRVTVDGGHLRQNGYSREKIVASAADAALAVSELVSPYAAWVQPVLCFTGQDHLRGWSREVMLCSTSSLVDMLTTRPVVFTPEHVQYLRSELSRSLARANVRPSALPSPRPSRTRASGPRSAARKRTSRRKGPSLTRFVVGVAMLFLLVSIGPQLATGIAGILTEQFTSNLGTPSCAEEAEAGSRPDTTGGQKERAKKRAQRAAAGKPATRTRDATAPNAVTDPCEGR